jgi:hypothetical protein
MKNEIAAKTVKPETPIRQPVDSSKQEKPAALKEQECAVKDISEIVASNDTNKFIITKFMRKGFTALSAEELASTMVSPDFTADF